MNAKSLRVRRYRDMIAIENEGIILYLGAEMCHLLSKALQDGSFDLIKRANNESRFVETQLITSETSV